VTAYFDVAQIFTGASAPFVTTLQHLFFVYSGTVYFDLRRAKRAGSISCLGDFRGHKPEAREVVFIVQAKPREPEGIIKVTKASRKEALQAASDFQNQGMPFVTIVADGRVYTAEEFALTVMNGPQ